MHTYQMVERGEIKSNRVRRTCRGTRDAKKRGERERGGGKGKEGEKKANKNQVDP